MQCTVVCPQSPGSQAEVHGSALDRASLTLDSPINLPLHSTPFPQTAVFSGVYSKALGDAGHLVRSGYCGANLVVSEGGSE